MTTKTFWAPIGTTFPTADGSGSITPAGANVEMSGYYLAALEAQSIIQYNPYVGYPTPVTGSVAPPIPAGPAAAPINAPFLTWAASDALTADKTLVAGAGVTFDTSVPDTLKINASLSPVISDASFVVLAATSSLPNERVLSTTPDLLLVDNGPGNSVSVGINNNRVATLSGSLFNGPVVAAGGLTGSLQVTATGLPYLTGLGGVRVSTGSLGNLSVSSSIGAPVESTYLTLTADAVLPNERPLVAGLGIALTDLGPGTGLRVANTAQGDRGASYVVIASTGSLTNQRQLAVGAGLSLTDNGGNSTVVLANTVPPGADPGAQYLTFALTGSLPNERQLVAGSNISFTDGGVNNTLAINNTYVAPAAAPVGATYLTLTNDGTLTSERVLTAGTNISFIDGGPNSSLQINSSGAAVSNNTPSTVSTTAATPGTSPVSSRSDHVHVLPTRNVNAHWLGIFGWANNPANPIWKMSDINPAQLTIGTGPQLGDNVWYIDLNAQLPPSVTTISGVTVQLKGATGHGALPSTMPQVSLASYVPGFGPSTYFTVNDTSANVAAYEAVHSVTATFGPFTAAPAGGRLILKVTGENGGTAVPGLQLLSLAVDCQYV